jgi:glycosyltransferase involved in cell wall biosynthesis
VYVPPNDIDCYARAIVAILDDETERRRMGALARARVEQVLAWRHQRDHYVTVYDRLTGHTAPDTSQEQFEPDERRVSVA